MVGVDQTTKGGMWTVAENYLNCEAFCRENDLKYIPTSITGGVAERCLFTAKALCRILYSLLVRKYDILHVHMSERGSVYRKNIVIDMARLAGCKIVLHMHGAEFQQWFEALPDKRKAHVRRILNKADQVIILGQYWSSFIQGLMDQKDKIQVIYNAVSVPEENRYNVKASNLLFLGAVGKRKGTYDLLEAIKLADDRLAPNVKLLIYGPDVDGIIEQKIGEAGLQHRVEYKGWLSAAEKGAVFENTAVNILPSYNEGLPMTILETMAYGIPNISTNVAAIPEVVNEENGCIICPGQVKDLAEQIVGIMADEAQRKRKSEAAYKAVNEKCSLDAHFDAVTDIYKKLAPNK